ncbi:MAG: aminoglycoside adenylyltransferase domain-containing protein [Actinomycetota bacterium]
MPRLPQNIQRLLDAFVTELDATLDDAFVGIFLYGAAMFPPSSITDFDAHVIVRTPFTDDDRARVNGMIDRIVASHDLERGYLDVWYVTEAAMRSHAQPQTELRPGFRDEHWAIHRAHWHAGRTVIVRGPDPRELVPPPTWQELDDDLQDALEDAAKHTNAYGTLNLCRVLKSYEMRDVVTSKYHSALWTLGFLDAEHHAIVRNALDAYERHEPGAGVGSDGFRDLMLSKVKRARELVAG